MTMFPNLKTLPSEEYNSAPCTIYPLQAFGIGDIIFTAELIKQIAGDNPVIWGAMPHFVDGLQRAYPQYQFEDYRNLPIDYSIKHDVIIGDKRIIPIRWSDSIMGVPYTQVMKSKYDMYGIDFTTWRNTTFKRDKLRENRLRDIVGAHGDYKVANAFYGSESQMHKAIALEGNVINMRTIDGYSLFDWAGVLEHASEVHAVSSSILYILELLDLNMPLHLYPRKEDPGYRQVDYIFTKDYKLH